MKAPVACPIALSRVLHFEKALLEMDIKAMTVANGPLRVKWHLESAIASARVWLSRSCDRAACTACQFNMQLAAGNAVHELNDLDSSATLHICLLCAEDGTCKITQECNEHGDEQGD